MGGSYLRWRLGVADESSCELFMALLGEVGFEAFETKPMNPEGEGVLADHPKEDIPSPFVMEAYGLVETVGHVFQDHWLGESQDKILWIDGPHPMPNTNWNAEWESNFQPVRLGKSLGLRAPFHEPMGDVDLELVMMPRMSFGTGHHETTLLMSWWLLGAPTDQTIQIGQKVLWEPGPQRIETVEGLPLPQNPKQDAPYLRLKGIRVLDMGCGTGILGILAARLGASSVIGIDVEAWSAENAAENATRNAVPAQGSHADWLCGDAEMLPSLWAMHGKFDLILANINRNILLKDMAAYDGSLLPGGQLWLSGFYTEDHGVLLQEAKRLGLDCVGSAALNQWSTLLFQKV